ncbi:uncharacterized protein LOC125814083 [Solanum verrucosum]|uniref:uncharacterized protein LOC125814083 n=1 Tax=Solanum verrucosum TaxID=315347 RepID=UPI0020D1E25C|nr:uncharacterized protein LOC125814083 [Solanum verrucosum]
MVVDSTARMSKFVFGVSEMVVKDCRTAMLISDMDISSLIVHTQQIEEHKLKKKSREAKRANTGDGNFSHARSDRHSRLRFQQKFSSQGSSNSLPMSTCTWCGRKHEGKCLAGMDGFFSCGKSGHKMRDCPIFATKGKERRRAPTSVSGRNTPKPVTP